MEAPAPRPPDPGWGNQSKIDQASQGDIPKPQLSMGGGTLAVAAQIALLEDGPGSYRFTFGSPRGKLSGRVTVGIEGPPDRRSYQDREQAAKNQILALSREFAQGCGD